MTRATRTDFQKVYRLVVTRTLAGEAHTEFIGPYQTLGAARGQLTDNLRMRSWEHYETKTGHIEMATGWEKVEN